MDLKNQRELKIFIGWDEVENVAWHALSHSIVSQSTIPISIHPVSLKNYQSVFNRERDEKQSNEFSFSRFLVPYMSDYSGWAVFMDCDMMLRTDIAELLEYIDETKALLCVQHNYEAVEGKKYLGTTQYAYPRKNWSSFVLWNCGHQKNKCLSKDFVENASGLQLHRFSWLDEEEIGSLPIDWNWLVGDYVNPPDTVKNVHWTLGGPYFNEYEDVDFSDEWREMHAHMNYCKQLKTT